MPQHEQLLEHQDFLRRLANGLVRDAQSAEDLVQNALLTGLRRPPAHSGNLRAWLGRVLVNGARSDRRAAVRQAERERQVARPEKLLPDAQAMERLELQRALLDALSRLPEATRTTMVMRYYEGLTPLAIAARLGNSHDTIKSQLRRGLEAMRHELDRGHGGDRDRWLLALAPLMKRGSAPPAAAAAASATTKTIWIGATMTTTTKWAAVGTVVLLGVIALILGGTSDPELHRERADAPANGDMGPAGLGPDTALANTLEGLEDIGERRASTNTRPEAPKPLPQPSLPALIVRDADSGAGIEDFTLISRDQPNDTLRDQGEFHAPGGRLTASEDPGLLPYGSGRRSFTVWAAGYGAKAVMEENFGQRSEVIVELERGAVPMLRGVVMNSGLPDGDAQVALCAYRRLSWQPSELTALALGKTDRRGGFELSGAAGHYVLRVISPAGTAFRVVELPAPDPLTIDLGELGSLDLLVHDAAGKPLPDIISILRRVGDNSRKDRHETDAGGCVAFANVEPGEWHLSLHGTKEHFHNMPWVERKFTLAAGAHLELKLSTPDPEQPRHVRLVVEGGTPRGWHAQVIGSEEWIPASPQGDVDVDLSLGSTVRLKSPGKAVWRWSVPPYSPDEGVVEMKVPATPFAYRGRVLSRVNGAPIRCRVFCYVQPRDGPINTVEVRTDAEGRFVLPLSKDAVTPLTFGIGGSNSGDNFKPNYAPSASPPLELRIFSNNAYLTDPNITLTPVSGRVTETQDGSGVVGGYVRIQAIFDDPQGTYEVGIDSSNSMTDADGRYSALVPVADRFVVKFWEEWTNEARTVSAEKGRLVQGETAIWDLVLSGDSK